MSQKNETAVLVLATLLTLGLVGAGAWWLMKSSGVDLGRLTNNRLSSPEQSNLKSFSQVQNVPSGVFNYGGSTTWVSIRKEVDPVIESVYPNFRLRYTDPDRGAPSSVTGVRMLLDNQLSFSQTSVPIADDAYQQAQKLGFSLQEIPVAIDGVAIAVNPSLNIKGLTVEQFNSIYAGKITNWSAVGGPNLKIIPYGKKDRDTNPAVKLIPTTTEALRLVAATPGGIYYTSAPLVVSQCHVKPLPLGRNVNEFVPPYKLPFVPLSECPQKRNQVNTEAFLSGQYPLSRRLSVVVKQNNQVDQQAGVAYAQLLLTAQGQELIKKAGFVSLR
ncbi:substrate-binding domain-containing protein [Aetokthonos hydrillicola Thurmond2011]|jgi:phosphate transport system substrate-binding protein|uniref:Substrate-binding domain-containing protein n=1 Tax=Aetokthonos hydrillicola Thurmond2011 TaxID=2712845 RepID=A0AAP5MDU0_9CYAN|nr:substrate-binding domain-containing protein [Aetokthonos hydrillicola]MBO3460088.1 phosphate ABC transporter substrate-binding protein [Aetokthonos hydrillicola CCALA 1050]MBW4589513.1 substrate-binding domain-containing protein [Aetokthonos hydrillicola CCALA 1050]MDR9899809.1 substrate-binding domain-containing protein [Aetokthonos hydrillicola Thurmond2011]